MKFLFLSKLYLYIQVNYLLQARIYTPAMILRGHISAFCK